MADIAELGFAVNTDPIEEANRQLTKLGPASATAAAGAAKASAALNTTASTAKNAAAGVTQSNAAAAAAAGSFTTAGNAAKTLASGLSTVNTAGKQAAAGLVAANQNIGLMKANTANIAAQFQDIGVTAAMGMNPLQIALQQGTQLASVFASLKPADAVKALAAAFGSLFSVVSIATIGIVAIIAGLVEFVNWVSVGKTALNALADGLVAVAPYAVAVGVALGIAFAPSIIASIWGVATAIASGVLPAIAGVVGLIGIIPLSIAAVVAGFMLFGQELGKIFGVDIVGYVKTGVNYIIGSFVGAYHDIELLWKQFPNIIGAAAIGAANMAIRATNAIVAAGVRGINTLINAANAIAGIAGMTAATPLDEKTGQFQELANTAADDLAKAVQGRNDQLQKDLTTDYLGAIGGAITDATSNVADKIRGLASGLGEGKAPKTKGSHGKTEAEKFDDIVNGAERSIAALEAERAAIGLSEEATARLKYETQLLNEAKQKNITLTPEMREKLMGLADTMATLEVETKRVSEAFDFAKDLTKGFFQDFASGIQQGKSFWESFGDAALNVLNKIVDKLLNDVIDAIFQVNGAVGGGGGFWGSLGGIFSGLFGGGGSDPGIIAALGLARGGVFDKGVQMFASGGIVNGPTPFAHAGGLGVMGEAGPETIMPVKRMGNGDMGVAAIMPANQNGGQTVIQQTDIHVDVTGANGDKQIRDMVEQGVTQGLEKFDQHVLPSRVNEIANDRRVR